MSKKQRKLFMQTACEAIDEGELIPIIGDTIRNEHIFDIDDDNNIGLSRSFWNNEQPIYRADTGPISHRDAQNINDVDENISIKDDQPNASSNKEWIHNLSIDLEKMNITEELAYFWAKSFEDEEDEDLKYPLADSFNIARVAQYVTYLDDRDAKREYLTFLKRTLLKGAVEIAKMEEDEEEIAYLEHMSKRIRDFNTFSDLVTELDFPRFSAANGKTKDDDPLHLLANLNQKLYITTSYHDFIERELEAANRSPRTRVCQWKDFKIDPQHVAKKGELLSREEPIVFHLLGLEQYPDSLVLSENDYLDLFWALGHNDTGADHKGLGIIPSYVEAGLKDSPLLLLGYRLHDWDLRVVLRGLCRGRQGVPEKLENKSMAIQIDIKEQPLVTDPTHAEGYLRSYYGKQISNLNVEFDDSATFVKAMVDKYYDRDWE